MRSLRDDARLSMSSEAILLKDVKTCKLKVDGDFLDLK